MASYDLTAIGKRLAHIRAVFGKELPTVPGWEEFENGSRLMPLETAADVNAATGVTLDWIYFGDEGGLRKAVADRLRN